MSIESKIPRVVKRYWPAGVIALSATLAAAGIATLSDNGEDSQDTGITLTAVRVGAILEQPNAIQDPEDRIGTLEVGQEVVGICYFSSQTLGADSVGLEDGGFTFIFTRDESQNLIDNFDISAVPLSNNLPECEL